MMTGRQERCSHQGDPARPLLAVRCPAGLKRRGNVRGVSRVRKGHQDAGFTGVPVSPAAQRECGPVWE